MESPSGEAADADAFHALQQVDQRRAIRRRLEIPRLPWGFAPALRIRPPCFGSANTRDCDRWPTGTDLVIERPRPRGVPMWRMSLQSAGSLTTLERWPCANKNRPKTSAGQSPHDLSPDNAGTSSGRIPANVSDRARATVIAGFAKDVEGREPVGGPNPCRDHPGGIFESPVAYYDEHETPG